MGWTFMPSRGRDAVEIIRGQLEWENDIFTDKVIDHAVVGTTLYLLVCRTPKAAWEPSTTYVNDADGSFRWIAVVLTSKARDAYDLGYKELEESMGPVEARCPRRLIDAASPFAIPIQPPKGITPRVGVRNASIRRPPRPGAKPNSFTAPRSASPAFSTSPMAIRAIALSSKSSSGTAATAPTSGHRTAVSIASAISTRSVIA
jgi:hypothetical protein